MRPSFGWPARVGEDGPPKRVDRHSDRRRGQYSVCILLESARVIGRGQTPAKSAGNAEHDVCRRVSVNSKIELVPVACTP